MPEMSSPYAAKPVFVPEDLVSRYVEAGFSVVEPEPKKKASPRKSRDSSDS